MDSITSVIASLPGSLSSTALANPPARTTLTSLPLELLIPIAKQCNQETALSLALVCRSLRAPAEQGIWQRLELCLPPHFGEYPFVLPSDPPRNRHDFELWSELAHQDAISDADERYTSALADKLRKVMIQGSGTAENGRRRFDLVRSVKVVNKAKAAEGILRLFEVLAPRLDTLDLVGSHPSSYYATLDEYVHATDTLDYRILTSSLSFPALTHLHLGPLAMQNEKLLPHLCAIAPRLTSLDVESQVYYPLPPGFASALPKVRVMPGTIETMCFTLRAADVSFAVQCDDHFDRIEREYIASIVGVLKANPRVRQLSLDLCNNCPPSLQADLISIFCEHDEPWDLHLSIDLSRSCRLLPVLTAFPSLRRLVIESHHWYGLLYHIPALTSLETILLIPPPHLRDDPSLLQLPLPASPEAYDMPPHLAEQLRACPRLHKVCTLSRHGTDYFAELELQLEASGNPPTLLISSLHPGSSELLYARFLMRYPVIDDPSTGGSSAGDWTSRRIQDGAMYRGTCFDMKGHPAWVTFTDFEGLTVPLEVIERMRVMEGVSRGRNGRRERWK